MLEVRPNDVQEVRDANEPRLNVICSWLIGHSLKPAAKFQMRSDGLSANLVWYVGDGAQQATSQERSVVQDRRVDRSQLPQLVRPQESQPIFVR